MKNVEFRSYSSTSFFDPKKYKLEQRFYHLGFSTYAYNYETDKLSFYQRRLNTLFEYLQTMKRYMRMIFVNCLHLSSLTSLGHVNNLADSNSCLFFSIIEMNDTLMREKLNI